MRTLAVTGVVATLLAMVATALTARPAERFVWTAGSLTAISLVAPLVSGAAAVTVVTLIGLHLIAAAVMIPALAQSLRARA